MSLDNKPIDLKEKTRTSINAIAENANQAMEEKKEQYDATMKKYNVFKLAKENMYKNWQRLKNTTDAKGAYAKYQKACNSAWDAEVDSDILRSSYQDTIFYSAKMSTSAIVSDAILNG